MSLNKKKMVREIGRRTRLKNRDVQAVIETLIEVWADELANRGRIEIENFMVLDCIEKVYIRKFGEVSNHNIAMCRLRVKTGKQLQKRLEASS